MFFTPETVVLSIKNLQSAHPFLGITFLACKQNELPVGSSIEFGLDAATDRFLKNHHKISPGSNWFFQPFKSSGKNKKWVRPDYAAKGLQAVNTQTFKEAFLHEKNTSIWGWSNNYITIIKERIGKQKISAFDLAVWIYKSYDFEEYVTAEQLIDKFFLEFHISSDEELLFDRNYSQQLSSSIFQAQCPVWEDYRNAGLPEAPDTAPERGGTLSSLQIFGLGHCYDIILQPTTRLTLITGDNGLGKTFLLDAAWWALTGTWAEMPSYPLKHFDFPEAPYIAFAIRGKTGKETKHKTTFDSENYTWKQPGKRHTIPGLCVYARTDGSFAIWDPAQHEAVLNSRTSLSSKEVWYGAEGLIEGLLRDWVSWQTIPSSATFSIFRQVLERLSPPDLGKLSPGEPVRIPGEPRQVPTIKHKYGTVPVLFASAGVRRIITLAYLIVWAWTEHLLASKQKHVPPQNTLIVLIDELEAHLHPKWQRKILPALLDVAEILIQSVDNEQNRYLEIQFLVATHSPLIMASVESVFKSELDSVFHLEADNNFVVLSQQEYINYGDVSAWLESPVFEFKHARSLEAELALEEAMELQKSPTSSTEQIQIVHNKLKRHLSNEDKFWPRWIGFAMLHGWIYDSHSVYCRATFF